MTSYKELCHASLRVGKKNPDIFLSSLHPRKDDYFYVVVNDKILAHIYLYKKQWYIWYCKKSYRRKVADFTTACNQLEEEIMNCVA